MSVTWRTELRCRAGAEFFEHVRDFGLLYTAGTIIQVYVAVCNTVTILLQAHVVPSM